MMNWKNFKNGDFPKTDKFCWVICENEILPRLGYYDSIVDGSTLENFLIRDWKNVYGLPQYWAEYKHQIPADKNNIFLDSGTVQVLLDSGFIQCKN